MDAEHVHGEVNALHRARGLVVVAVAAKRRDPPFGEKLKGRRIPPARAFAESVGLWHRGSGVGAAADRVSGLERSGAPTYRVRAFRRAAEVVAGLSQEELTAGCGQGRCGSFPGMEKPPRRRSRRQPHGREPEYLTRLLGGGPQASRQALRAAMRGDCHAHSDWSDGGSPIEEMVTAAIELGHSYLVLTDHSPRLTVARGLSAPRLAEQIEVVAALNATLIAAGVDFRLLSGIEVDILADGSLDQEESLLARLDVVVGSVHSGLRGDPEAMTNRMLKAVTNPHLDILGHCTGRKLATGSDGGDRAHRGGKARPESQFDAPAVFAACHALGKAVEINCRPDRLDPPKRLLRLAHETGCLFAIDTDAHAPGQLDWLGNGCGRAGTVRHRPGPGDQLARCPRHA